MVTASPTRLFHTSSRMLWLGILLLTALAWGGGFSPTWAAAPVIQSARVIQPEYLSLQVDNPLTVLVVASEAYDTRAICTLASADHSVVVPVLTQDMKLHPGLNTLSVVVRPEMLASFIPNEEVIFSVGVEGQSDVVVATTLFIQASPRASSWSLAFVTSPVVLSTVKSTQVQLVVNNPSSRTEGKITLLFADSTGHAAASAKSSANIPRGSSTVSVDVPDSTSRRAQSGGASIVIGSIRVRSSNRATATAPLVFDAAALSIAPSASPTSGSAPLAVAFMANASGGTPPYSFDWNFDDGSAHEISQDPSHTYDRQGSYQVELHVRDSAGAEADDHGIHIEIASGGGGGLTASASASPPSGPAPLTVAFSGSGTGGTPPYSYEWNFGDGSPGDESKNPSHTYASAGTYGVKLEVKDSSDHESEARLFITVSEGGGGNLSVSASGAPLSGVAPLAVSFTGTPSGGVPPYSYNWNFGDGSVHATTQNPSHTYAAAGSYSASLTVTDSASATATSAAIAITVTASIPPLAVSASGAPLSGVAPLAVSFTGTPSGGVPPYSYNWNFGDGSVHATTQNPSHTYAAAGSYSASLTVTDSASATATSAAIAITVTASIPPLAVSASGAPLSGVAPLAVSFTGTPSGGVPPYSYNWNFGDGSVHATTQNPSHTYAAAGSYSASLTVTDSASATATSAAIAITVTASIPPLAVSASGAPLSGVAPLAVSFTGTPSGGVPPYSYNWNFGDGSVHATTQNPSHTYMAAGSYSASLTVTDSASATATSAAIAITVTAPVATLSAIQASLFTPSCSGCHGGSNPTAGLNLSAGQSYSNLVNVVSTTNPPMLRVKPNDTANSFLVVQLAGGHRNVSPANQQAIKDWINAGAPNN